MSLVYLFASMLLIVLSFYASGAWIREKLTEGSCALKMIISIAFGMTCFGFFLIVIGHFKIFNIVSISAYLIISLLLGARFIRPSILINGTGFLSFKALSVEERLAKLLLLILGVFTFLLCLIPETANDSLCYQLYLPKRFCQSHSTWPIYFELNSYMPLFMNYLYAAALVFKQVSLAKAMHWLTSILLTALILIIIRKKSKSSFLSYAMAVAFFLTPTFFNQIANTYTDNALTFFSFLSLVLLLESNSVKSKFVSFLCGTFFGVAVGIKFFTLAMWAPFLSVFWIYAFIKNNKRETLEAFLWFCLGALWIGGFWFVRNWIIVGNPVYPYLGELFNTPGLSNLSMYMGIGLPKTFLNYILLIWHFAVDPDMFGRGHWMGPLYLVLFPFFVLGFVKNKALFGYGLFIISFMAVWFFLAQSVRYALPVLPPYMVISSVGLSEAMKRPFWNGMLKIGGSLLIGALLALGIWHYRFPLSHFSLNGKYHEFLIKKERSYEIATWINQNLPERSKILNAEEIRQFYFDREVIREQFLNARTNYAKDLNPEQMISYYKLNGFTHILKVWTDLKNQNQMPKRIEKLNSALKNSHALKKIYEIKSNNLVEGNYHYELYEIL